jgi:hypothetical protein
VKEKPSKAIKLRSFLIGGIVFSAVGAMFGIAVKASIAGAIMGFFVGGWVSIELSMIIFAAEHEKENTG